MRYNMKSNNVNPTALSSQMSFSLPQEYLSSSQYSPPSTPTYLSLPQARKEMGNKNIEKLIRKAQKLASELKTKELEIIEVLQELDSTKAYRASGYNSLYTFCTTFLNLSEYQAYHYITVARKIREVPLLKSALFDKKITISKARRLCSVINKDNQEEWIRTAQKSTHKELDQSIRKKDPRVFVPDRTSYLTETHLKLQATISQGTYNKLQRVRELLIRKGIIDYDNVFKKLADEFLERHDPVKRAQRWEKSKGPLPKLKSCGTRNLRVSTQKLKETDQNYSSYAPKSDSHFTSSTLDPQGADSISLNSHTLNFDYSALNSNSPILDIDSHSVGSMNHHLGSDSQSLSFSSYQASLKSKTISKSFSHSISHKRKPIPSSVQHQVFLRDRGRCQFKCRNQKCLSGHFIELHHKIPVALGGEHKLNNLVTLCSSHHKWVHKKGP